MTDKAANIPGIRCIGVKNILQTKLLSIAGHSLEKKGNKIVTVFKNSDGSLNKKAVTIAALATA